MSDKKDFRRREIIIHNLLGKLTERFFETSPSTLSFIYQRPVLHLLFEIDEKIKSYYPYNDVPGHIVLKRDEVKKIISEADEALVELIKLVIHGRINTEDLEGK